MCRKKKIIFSWEKLICSKKFIFKSANETIPKYPITKPFNPSIKFVPFTRIKTQNNTKIKLINLNSNSISKKGIRVETISKSRKYIKININKACKKNLFFGDLIIFKSEKIPSVNIDNNDKDKIYFSKFRKIDKNTIKK